MTTELDDVEKRIIETVSDICKDGVKENWKSNVQWTAEIKNRIGNLGNEKGYYICATGWKLPKGQGDGFMI